MYTLTLICKKRFVPIYSCALASPFYFCCPIFPLPLFPSSPLFFILSQSSFLPSPSSPCPCPGVTPDAQFASSCEEGGSGRSVVCVGCREGHTGDRCEACAIGYFGNPQGINTGEDTSSPLPTSPSPSPSPCSSTPLSLSPFVPLPFVPLPPSFLPVFPPASLHSPLSSLGL